MVAKMPSLKRICLCFSLLQTVCLRSTAMVVNSTMVLDEFSATTNNASNPLTTLAPIEADTFSPLEAYTASKLVRLRREPPVTIVKHIIRASKRGKPNPRRRYKRPKIKYSYGPPPHPPLISHSYVESKPYKPSLPPPSIPEYTYSHGDDFSGYELGSSSFDVHPSSYEAQSMDLDFYSHNIKAPPVEYDFDVAPKYERPKSPPRKPHESYGVPQDFSYSSGFNSGSPSSSSSYYPSDSLNSLAEHPTYSTSSGSSSSSWQPSSPAVVEAYPSVSSYPSGPSYSGGLHIPATKYGVPAAEVPSSYSGHEPSIKTEYAPSSGSSGGDSGYPMYEQKLPNAGYGSFAEPPKTQYNSVSPDIEITPSFEIDLSPATSYEPPDTGGGGHYQETSNSHPGHFAEPPSPGPPAAPSQPHPGSAEDYLPPTKELPLSPNHKPPTYDYPKSSYEVPIYDPIPFEASNSDHHEFYPPHPYPEDSADIAASQEPQHDPEESQQDSRYVPQPKPSPAKPPEAPETPKPSEEPKRKRQRGGGNSPSKHILDAPELEHAFEAGHRNLYSDPLVNESNLSVNKQHGENYVHQPPWNPMRIRTPESHHHQTPLPTATAVTSSAAGREKPTTPKLQAPRKRRLNRGQSRWQPSTEGATQKPVFPAEPTTKISILSVEKSRSHSYYDGTMAPSTVAGQNYPGKPHRYKGLPPRGGSSNRQDNIRTTKSAFETTYFKAPINDRALGMGVTQKLPKNHRPY